MDFTDKVEEKKLESENIKEVDTAKEITKEAKVDKKDFSMKYFNFFRKVFLVLILVINCLILSSYTRLDNWDEYTFVLILLNLILYVIMPIVLLNQLPLMTKVGYKVVLSFFILDYIYKISIGTMNEYANFPNRNISYYVGYFLGISIIYSIWYAPNIVYFYKRRSLFVN